MAYIETHQSLLTHRKTLRLGRLLGMDRFCVCGRLMALWCWALDNAPEGVVAVADGDILADVMGWEGEPAALCEALVTAGFFELADGFYVLHDWYVYAGKLIEKRKSDAERKRLARSGSGRPADAQWTSVGYPTDGAGTVPNRSQPDLSPRDPSRDLMPPAPAQAPPSPPSAPAVASAGDPDDSSVDDRQVASHTTPAPEPSPKPPKLKPIYSEDSVPMQLARALGAGIHRNKPDAKLPHDGLQGWAREFDLMLRVDHRPREKIEAVIAYAMRSSFWRSVVFSAAQIRRKFDVIDAQRQEDASGTRNRQAAADGGGNGSTRRGYGGGSPGGAGGGSRPRLPTSEDWKAIARRMGQLPAAEDGGDAGGDQPAPARAAGG